MTAGIWPAARRRRAYPLPKFSRTSAMTLVSVSVVSLPGHQVSLLIRRANAVLELEVAGKQQLTLVKDVQKDPVHQINLERDGRVVEVRDRAGEGLAQDDDGHVDLDLLALLHHEQVDVPSRSTSRAWRTARTSPPPT
jgi:ribosomal protein L25 (general stress protein Ctc)